jgi:predicted DNA-binding antitoxin AbrB/MazE fold protein
MEQFIEAQVVDSHHLKLKKPIKLAPGSTVMISIETSEEQEWYLFSSKGLEEAYSEDEPEYSLERIKFPNPEYQP